MFMAIADEADYFAFTMQHVCRCSISVLTGRVVAEQVVLVGEKTLSGAVERGAHSAQPDGVLHVAAQAEHPGHDVEELRAAVAAAAASLAQGREVVGGDGHDAVVHLDRQTAQRTVGRRVHDI